MSLQCQIGPLSLLADWMGPRHGVEPLSQSVSFLTFGFPILILSEGSGFIAQANVSLFYIDGFSGPPRCWDRCTYLSKGLDYPNSLMMSMKL
jgi:hypothetical protein